MRHLLTLALLAVVAGCSSTEPFRDADGRIVPGSIATLEDVSIGGVSQRIWLRGINRNNPPLILLHGGPGASEAPLFRHYNAALEQGFVVVYWEQRGAGRSFHGTSDAAAMNIEQFVADLDELVDVIRERFHADKVVLLGHSWGTTVGTRYAFAHPEKVAAYVGTGQDSDKPAEELASYRFAVRQASARNDNKAIAQLEGIGPPPHTVEQMFTSRHWVEEFGGAFHAELSTGTLIWAALRTDETTPWDLVRFGRGNAFSLAQLWQEYSRSTLTGYRSFHMPVYFLLGRYDEVTPSNLAAKYLDGIEAPLKKLIWFESSAHNVPFEEPEKFNQVLVDVVRPEVLRRTHLVP